jgi:hypothetical protein
VEHRLKFCRGTSGGHGKLWSFLPENRGLLRESQEKEGGLDSMDVLSIQIGRAQVMENSGVFAGPGPIFTQLFHCCVRESDQLTYLNPT